MKSHKSQETGVRERKNRHKNTNATRTHLTTIFRGQVALFQAPTRFGLTKERLRQKKLTHRHCFNHPIESWISTIVNLGNYRLGRPRDDNWREGWLGETFILFIEALGIPNTPIDILLEPLNPRRIMVQL